MRRAKTVFLGCILFVRVCLSAPNPKISARAPDSSHGRDRQPRHPMKRLPRTEPHGRDRFLDEFDVVEFGKTIGGGEATRLRSDLLRNYDRGSYPFEFAWMKSGWMSPMNATAQNGTDVVSGLTNSTTIREGVVVEVGINFHRVFSVDVISSVADLIVWFRQRWTDPRLAWDPAEYNGLKNIWFWIGDGVGGGEASEIWTPDIEVWNMETSLKHSLADAYATVDNKGSVFWSRPGHLRPVCKFKGLNHFPFDSLRCTMEFGSWSYSGLYLRPSKMGEGFSIGGSETAGEAFAEYSLVTEDDGVTCREHVYPPYPALPEEDWPVLFYDITFHRSWQPYVRGYIIMQVILNISAFACFWIPIQCGERIGLAITAMLAAVASELVVSGRLPSASEMTWFQSFSLFSLAFAVFALLESVAVVYFFYYTGDDLVPRYVKWLRQKFRNDRRIAAKKSRSSNDIIREHSEKSRSLQNGWGNDDESSNGMSSSKEDHDATSPDTFDGDDEIQGEDDSHDGGRKVTFHIAQSSAPSDKLNTRATERPSLLRSMSLMPDPGSFRRGLDADDFINTVEADNNRRWKKVALAIDEVSRLVFPVVYSVTLAILLGRVEYK